VHGQRWNCSRGSSSRTATDHKTTSGSSRRCVITIVLWVRIKPLEASNRHQLIVILFIVAVRVGHVGKGGEPSSRCSTRVSNGWVGDER
jgi:hypothetical protein